MGCHPLSGRHPSLQDGKRSRDSAWRGPRIGRFLKSLQERETDRETVIIFLSDNGAEGNAIDRILDNAYWISNTFDNRLNNLGRHPPEGSGEWELFNIATDPTETTDLAADFPDVIAELSADWDEYAKANGVAVFEKDMGYGRYYGNAFDFIW